MNNKNHQELKQFNCKVESQAQADYLTELCKEIYPEFSNYKNKFCKHYSIFAFFEPKGTIRGKYGLVAEGSPAEFSTINISYQEFVDKAKKALKRFNIELTKEEVFYLRAFIGSGHTESRKNFIDRSWYPNLISNITTDNDYGESLFSKMVDICEENDITDEIFKPTIKTFEFENGKVATINNENDIKIGCRSYTKEYLLTKYMPMFDLVDEIIIEGLGFRKQECIEFAELLKSI